MRLCEYIAPRGVFAVPYIVSLQTYISPSLPTFQALQVQDPCLGATNAHRRKDFFLMSAPGLQGLKILNPGALKETKIACSYMGKDSMQGTQSRITKCRRMGSQSYLIVLYTCKQEKKAAYLLPNPWPICSDLTHSIIHLNSCYLWSPLAHDSHFHHEAWFFPF
jgi:hypothetical protein